MSRNREYTALVLSVKAFGESNREAAFLTAEEGIVRAALFGGPKSHLRSHISPFNYGRLWLYHDPVRDSLKVNDFDVVSWHPGLRELYERSMAAGTVVEAILAGHGGGGDWEEALALGESALDALENASETGAGQALLQFLWRWIVFLGYGPDAGACAACGRPLPAGDLFYSPGGGSFLCPACGGPERRIGGRFLAFLGSQTAFPALDPQALREGRLFIGELSQSALGKRLC
jgi:DNA repair protein RecO (recombination protein O)